MPACVAPPREVVHFLFRWGAISVQGSARRTCTSEKSAGDLRFPRGLRFASGVGYGRPASRVRCASCRLFRYGHWLLHRPARMGLWASPWRPRSAHVAGRRARWGGAPALRRRLFSADTAMGVRQSRAPSRHDLYGTYAVATWALVAGAARRAHEGGGAGARRRGGGRTRVVRNAHAAGALGVRRFGGGSVVLGGLDQAGARVAVVDGLVTGGWGCDRPAALWTGGVCVWVPGP